MLMTIVMTIIVAAIVATVASLFTEDKNVALVILESLGIGAVFAAVNNYLIPMFPELSWLFLLITLGFIGALMYQWYKQGSSLVEFLCFTGLTIIVGWMACAAGANYAPVTIIPLLVAIIVPIFAIGFYAYAALRFHRGRNVLEDDKREELLENGKGETVQEMDKKARRFNRLMSAVVVVTLVIIAGVTGVVKGMADGGVFEGAPDLDPVDTADAATFIPAKAEDILVKWTKKESNRIDSEFSDKLKAEAGDGEITPEIVKKVILEDCKDPSVLAIWGYKFGLYEDPDKYEPLMIKEDDKEKLSEEGVRLYNKVEGYLEAVSAEREEAPEDGTNTGYNDGFVVAETSGISGDRTGTKMTCPNGEVFWVMDRCSNIVYKGNPPKDVPRGDTDEPKKQNYKDQSKRKAVGNDDKGAGENTIGSDPNHSTKDRKDNSTSMTYDQYKDSVQDKKEVNKSQKTGSDSNTPSTSAPSSNTNVDNNGDKGNGGAPINTPTPKREAETVKNDPPADHMDEPS